MNPTKLMQTHMNQLANSGLIDKACPECAEISVGYQSCMSPSDAD